jgi:hypothetical protein
VNDSSEENVVPEIGEKAPNLGGNFGISGYWILGYWILDIGGYRSPYNLCRLSKSTFSTL